MKVMHLIGGGDVGGAKTHVLSLVAHLCSEAEALLVSLRAGEFADDAKAFGIPTTVVRTGNPVKDIMTLKNLVLSGKFDIVHCHGSKANVMGAILARLCKCPVITTVHSDYRLDYMGSPIKQYTFGVLNTMALRLLDGYISVTGTFQDMLIERGFDPYHVYPIYNGLDFTAQLAPQMSRVDYLNSIGLTSDDDTVVFGIAARLHPVKDIGTIVRAFAKTVKSCPNMRLVIGGDGEQMEYLSGLVREFKLDEYVAMPGWITDMDTFLEAIDVNLLSSLSESFPYSVLEAVRAGCTMVCSSVGGMPILIDHGANGLLFTPQDVDKLGEHMSYLYNNPDERREMAEKLLEKARKLYSIDKMVSDQLEIYRTVLRDYESEKKKRAMITICGSYGRGNAGDDAILSALKGEFSEIEKDVRICVMSRNPKSTKKIYHIRSVFTFNIFKMAGSMLKSHLYVNGGGSLIQDSTSSRSLYFYLFTLIAARILGCDVMMYGCGIGPVRGKTNRRIAAWVINHTATSITLRDPGSGEELTRMGVIRPQITLAADPTLNLAPASDEVVKSAFFSEGLTM
ncbi:MAG: glycosyltransferase, partial [Clostridia bacterium]